MPWKQGYTISDEKSLSDDEVRWPDGNRCCISVVVDLSPARGPEGIRAADLMSPAALFAMHGGLDGLLSVLRRFDIKATFGFDPTPLRQGLEETFPGSDPVSVTQPLRQA
jgi:hypothetical protein